MPSKSVQNFLTYGILQSHRHTDRQTDRQTDRYENITIFGDGNYLHFWSPRLARSHYCQQLTLSVCADVCLSRSFKLLFRWNRAIFLAVSFPCGTLQNVVLIFSICCHGNEIWAIFAKKIDIAYSFLFLDGIEPFLAISSPWPPLQNVVLWFFI